MFRTLLAACCSLAVIGAGRCQEPPVDPSNGIGALTAQHARNLWKTWTAAEFQARLAAVSWFVAVQDNREGELITTHPDGTVGRHRIGNLLTRRYVIPVSTAVGPNGVAFNGYSGPPALAHDHIPNPGDPYTGPGILGPVGTTAVWSDRFQVSQFGPSVIIYGVWMGQTSAGSPYRWGRR